MLTTTLTLLVSLAPPASPTPQPATPPPVATPAPLEFDPFEEDAPAPAPAPGPAASAAATPPPASTSASDATAPASPADAPADGQPARTDEVAPVPIVVVAAERPQPGPAPAPRARPAVESSAARILRPTFEPHEVKWRLDVGVGFGSNVAFDDSFGDLDNGEMSRDRIDIDATFSLPISDAGLFLGAKVGYRGVERSAVDLHQYYFGNLRQNELGFGVWLSFAPVEGVEPYVQLLGGPTFWRGESGGSAYFGDGSGLSVLDSEDVVFQDTTLGFVEGRAGLQLFLPRKWLRKKQGARVTAGLDLGVGYAWRPRFTPGLEIRDQDEDDIDVLLPSLGEVDPSALVWNVGLVLRVM